MNKIFIGFLFVFLDFNLNLNSCTIGLIPDFIGYIILIQGFNEMNSFSPRFAKVRPYAIGMAIYCSILYALDLFGASVSLDFISVLLGIVSTTISLYISYQLVCGVRDIEAASTVNLNSDKLLSTWKLLAVFQLITCLVLLIPSLAIFCIIVSFIFAVVFLNALHTSKKLFETMPSNDSAPEEGFYEE